MPGHAVMKWYHPMVGCDWHLAVVPPAPPVWSPYVTVGILSGITTLTQKHCPSHYSSGWGWTMARGTDIGPLIPHFGPPSTTIAMEIIFSSSKSYFGPRSYVEKDNTGADNCVAAALVIVLNPNLNCGTPTPTPTGCVFAVNTHFVAFTWGDIIAGFAQMAFDALIQTALFYIGNWIGGRLSGILPQAMSRTAARQAARAAGTKGGLGAAARAIRAKNNRVADLCARIFPRAYGAIFNIFGGGPGGADAGSVGGQSAFGMVGSWMGSRGDAFANYVTGGPPPANQGEPPERGWWNP